MSRARDLADSADKDIAGTLTLDGLTVAGNVSVDGGTIKLDGNYPTNTGNVALGNTALDSLGAGNYNTAVGHNALTANTDGSNTAFGAFSLAAVTTGGNNVAVGREALEANTADNNTALGYQSLTSNTTASNNTAVGYQAGYANTTGQVNTAVGHQALYSNTTASDNEAFGYRALFSSTTGTFNTSIGGQSLYDNTTGDQNVAVGYLALTNNTTSNQNTAIGSYALYSQTTASTGQNTALGHKAGYTGNSYYNTFLGYKAGELSTGYRNTFVGHGSGISMTTGQKNTILGNYGGNQGGLDIRTSSNNIVLSDGDGNPRLYYLSSASAWRSAEIYNNTTGNSANVTILSSGTIARSTSSLKYKRDVVDATHGLSDLLNLRSVTYKGKNPEEGDTVYGGLIAEEVHDAGLTEFVQYDTEGNPDALAYGNMVSLCIKAIQEQQATITALQARIDALENA